MQIARFYLGFYYEQLDIDQQVLYRRVAKAVANYEASFSLERFNSDSLRKVLVAVKYDNPEFAYWNMTESKEEEGHLVLKYLTTDEKQAEDLVSQMRNKRSQIMQFIHTSAEQMKAEMTEIEETEIEVADEAEMKTENNLARKLFAYLVKNVAYADTELERPVDHPWINEAQGPLLNGRGVCLGTALALKYLWDGTGIDSILITGKANVAGCYCNHAWNMVCSDGQYYHVDVTANLWAEEGADNSELLLDRSWSKALYPA